jgi:short-subunit dehydrogenase
MNKLIVVSGATKGIGRAIVEEFLKHGFDAAICARKQADLTTMKEEVENKFNGAKLYIFQADMAVKQQVNDFAAFVKSLNRPIEVLVNNAGFFAPGDIATEPDGTLESMIDANLYSAYYLTRGLIQPMREAKAGHIFNICSIASIKAYANGGSYAITKFAMLGLSKCLREELKPFDIRVTAVLPGATKTASWDGVDLPDDRFMSAEDVAATVYACNAISKRSVVEEILIRPQLGDI